MNNHFRFSDFNTQEFTKIISVGYTYFEELDANVFPIKRWKFNLIESYLHINWGR